MTAARGMYGLYLTLSLTYAIFSVILTTGKRGMGHLIKVVVCCELVSRKLSSRSEGDGNEARGFRIDVETLTRPNGFANILFLCDIELFKYWLLKSHEIFILM